MVTDSEETVDATTAQPKRGMLRDWGYYSIWWALIFAIISGVMYKNVPASELWAATLRNALFGAAFGLACAFFFTLVQNGLNTNRNKAKSWFFAILIWIAMKAGVYLAMGTV